MVRCVVFPTGGRPIDEAVARHIKQRGWGVERLAVMTGRLALLGYKRFLPLTVAVMDSSLVQLNFGYC